MKTIIEREHDTNTDRLQREESITPEVNIFETRDGYVIDAEMPGVDKKGLEITLEGNQLTIVGRRDAGHYPGTPLFRESRDANFRRSFELDPAIDTTKVSATMENGLLSLSLPKSDQVKPRKITISN
jgi:HSP20 family protein